MTEKFILSCESTVDLPYSYVENRDMPVIFYSYTVDGVEYEDDMCRTDDGFEKFFKLIDEGKVPTTSQINLYKYIDFFEDLLKGGKDILHIAFGSGLTPSVNNARQAAEQLKEKYPDQRIVIFDSSCACAGYGLLVDTAADLRDDGKSIDEIVKWLEENANKLHHQFFNSDMRYFKRSGRVSGPTATIATVLGICPIMRLDDKGKMVAYDKVRGKKNAIKKIVDEMVIHAGVNYNGKCFIAHANCLEDGKETETEVVRRLPQLEGKIKMFEIGTIISSHCGPGTVSLYFFGDERQPLK